MSSAANAKEDEVGAQAHVKPAEGKPTDAKKPVEEDVGDVPDPDEDDLDDLDGTTSCVEHQSKLAKLAWNRHA